MNDLYQYNYIVYVKSENSVSCLGNNWIPDGVGFDQQFALSLYLIALTIINLISGMQHYVHLFPPFLFSIFSL